VAAAHFALLASTRKEIEMGLEKWSKRTLHLAAYILLVMHLAAFIWYEFKKLF
jgi:hypothetical protein